jgi:hypothetical protein
MTDRRARARRAPLAAIVALVAIASILAACGTSGGSGGSAAAGGASPATTPDAECAIAQGPGPGDVPPTDGEMDTSGQGPGRWRLCLDTPLPVSVEGTAWCTWDDARQSVDAVSGLPSSAGGIDYDAFIGFDSSGFEVHLTDRSSGTIANYGPRTDLPEMVTDPDRRAGLSPVDVTILTGGDTPPSGAPEALGGRLRWACGDPPAVS